MDAQMPTTKNFTGVSDEARIRNQGYHWLTVQHKQKKDKSTIMQEKANDEKSSKPKQITAKGWQFSQFNR